MCLWEALLLPSLPQECFQEVLTDQVSTSMLTKTVGRVNAALGRCQQASFQDRLYQLMLGLAPVQPRACCVHGAGQSLRGVYHTDKPLTNRLSHHTATVQTGLEWSSDSLHHHHFCVWAPQHGKPNRKWNRCKAAQGYGNVCFRNLTLKMHTGPLQKVVALRGCKVMHVCQSARWSCSATGDYFPVIAVPRPLLHSAHDINHIVNTSDQRVHSPFMCLITMSFQCFLRNTTLFL